MKIEAAVPPHLEHERTDRIVAVLAEVSRAEARRLVEGGRVMVDGGPAQPAQRLAAGTKLVIDTLAAPPGLEPEEVAFIVRYEDDTVAVVDKPTGVVTHPGAGASRSTLAAGLLHRWPEIEGVGEADRWGLVHRLDKDTSGLLLVAKTAEALARLRGDLRRHRIRRTYRALVHGQLPIATGTIEAPLGRDPKDPRRFRLDPAGRPAVTHYRVLRQWPDVAEVEVELETGRTHQIRVHLGAIDHPLVGDRVYGRRGPEGADPGRAWLHAARLEFPHPIGRHQVVVESPLPSDLEVSLAALGPPLEPEAI